LPTTNARIVVQVGAFSDPAKAREARLKLERAGLKTYTNVAKTPQGERIRVRVGPFSTKAEADKAATKAKALGPGSATATLRACTTTPSPNGTAKPSALGCTACPTRA
jgi:DedD protein